MTQIDPIAEKFIADVLEREHRRLIATMLFELESHFGKNKRVSDIVKNVANSSKRIMFTQLTHAEVEPKEYSG
jgi:hypothetical protein